MLAFAFVSEASIGGKKDGALALTADWFGAWGLLCQRAYRRFLDPPSTWQRFHSWAASSRPTPGLCFNRSVRRWEGRSGEVCLQHILSTAHGHEEVDVPNCLRNGTIRKPHAVVEYNGNMGGVDKQDQLIEPYSCTRKTLKWTKNMFFHLMQMSACNAFIIAKKDGYSSTFLDFTESIAAYWVFPDREAAWAATEAAQEVTDDEVRLTERHFPTNIPPTEKKQYPSRVCVWSALRRASKGRRPETCAQTAHRSQRCACPSATDCTTPSSSTITTNWTLFILTLIGLCLYGYFILCLGLLHYFSCHWMFFIIAVYPIIHYF